MSCSRLDSKKSSSVTLTKSSGLIWQSSGITTWMELPMDIRPSVTITRTWMDSDSGNKDSGRTTFRESHTTSQLSMSLTWRGSGPWQQGINWGSSMTSSPRTPTRYQIWTRTFQTLPSTKFPSPAFLKSGCGVKHGVAMQPEQGQRQLISATTH